MESSSYHQISSLSLDKWVSLANQHLELQNTGRGNLYINKKSVAQFLYEETANKECFSKITLNKIYKITQKKLENSNNIDDEEKANKLLKKVKLKIEEEKSGNVEKLSNVFFQIEGKKIENKEAILNFNNYIESRKIDNEGNIIDEEMSIEVRNTLLEAFTFTRSRGGTIGVYSFSGGPDCGDIKIKLCDAEEVASHIVADKFFQSFGFITPHYCALKTTSTLGRLVCTQMKELAKVVYPENSVKFQSKIENLDYIVVMKEVPGTAFDQLTKDVVENIFLKDVFNYKNIFFCLGKMIFLDTFIKNKDRLNWECQNNGNYFLFFNNLNSNPIVLIDHDFMIQKVFLKNIKNDLIQLFEDRDGKKISLLSKTFDNLLSRFKDKYQWTSKEMENLTKDKEDFIKKALYEGVSQAALELVSMFPDKNDESRLQEILVLPTELKKFLIAKEFFELVEEVRKIIKEKL
ncbi:hypothetical protein [Candidatus Protochlamydia sp. R18]|uniref:hypothetical protein n=1 Tax=Candidatus Protochlamydia sp. R18 TaxID=1353977 RepID=UPI0005A8C292|nr:hypothetical protein [Candidatus Protochlamydia sp. R18]